MSQPSHQAPVKIPDADMTAIKGSIDTLKARLLPHLKTLSPEERRDILKMGDKTVPFVRKTLEHCRECPDLVPRFLDVNGLASEMSAFESIRTLLQPLLQLSAALRDTMILAGSEAYYAALSFYSSARNAMKSKVPKAKTIYSDLSNRFPGRPKKNSTSNV
jgi:hypothetical protein